jgi:formylmethanofuran dehydrogenase subunit A
MSFILRNGFVYDPLNNVNGERMDILVKDGHITKTT